MDNDIWPDHQKSDRQNPVRSKYIHDEKAGDVFIYHNGVHHGQSDRLGEYRVLSIMFDKMRINLLYSFLVLSLIIDKKDFQMGNSLV